MAVSDKHMDRLHVGFRTMDSDGDGVLEEGDFEGLASKLVASVQIPETSQKATLLRAFSARYWRGLRSATGPGGQVTFDEYARLTHTPQWFDEHMLAWAKGLAAVGDVDDDGYIERSEFAAMFQAVGFPADDIDALFAELDPDGAGRISIAAMVTMVRDYYVSEVQTSGDNLLPQR
jgi:Ca2+-binding EF-hand superfamily protein